jgi:hypothetical protein
MSGNKLLIGVGIGATALATYAYAKSLSLTQAHLEVIPSAMLHKINFAGVTIKMDVRLKNPDSASFNIKYPFIKLIHEGITLGSSQAIDKDIKLPAYGEAVINGIMIQIPLLNIVSTAYKMFQSLQKGGEIKLVALTITTIDLGWKKIPFEKKDVITLKKGSK